MTSTSEKRESARSYTKRYAESERGRETQRRYRESSEGRAKLREAQRRYAASDHGRAKKAEKQRRRREAHAAYMRAWREENPEKAREIDRRKLLTSSYLKRRCEKYGITVERYIEIVESQAGRCAICCEPPGDGSPLCVDHCHTTGAVRGLLCKVCNLAVGNLRDSAERARAALAYLERFSP